MDVILEINHMGAVEPKRPDATGVCVSVSPRRVLCNLLAEADQQVFLCIERFFSPKMGECYIRKEAPPTVPHFCCCCCCCFSQ